MAPFFLNSRMNSLNLNFVLQLDYCKEGKVLIFTTLELDGITRKFLPLEDLIPAAYGELYHQFLTNIPEMSYIDEEMVYKNKNKNEFYVF